MTAFSRERPTDWRPGQVRNPERGARYPLYRCPRHGNSSRHGLRTGTRSRQWNCAQPKGATGYVLKIDLEPSRPQLYVKLQLGSGKIIGRSFHYSERKE